MNNEKLTLRIHGLMRSLQMTKSELKHHAQFMMGVADDWIDYLIDQGDDYSTATDDLQFWLQVRDYLEH